MENNIARLDGFLAGVVSFSGKLRDYSASSYLIKSNSEIDTIKRSLQEFFNPRAQLTFLKVEQLEGLRELETEIRGFLVRGVAFYGPDDLLKMQRYLSFRVMELVSTIMADEKEIKVLKMDVHFSTSKSEGTFFCVQMKASTLVLQFNNDIGFKKQQREAKIVK